MNHLYNHFHSNSSATCSSVTSNSNHSQSHTSSTSNHHHHHDAAITATATTTGSNRHSTINNTETLPLHQSGLVGRDAERLVLEQAHDRVCCRVQQAPSELILVEGASGTGKTALVLSCLRESIEREAMGLLVHGKYDLKQQEASTTSTSTRRASSPLPISSSSSCVVAASATTPTTTTTSSGSSKPYEAIVDAATELCHAVVDSEYYLEDVREHLQSVLSCEKERGLLLTLVPAVSNLLELLVVEEDIMIMSQQEEGEETTTTATETTRNDCMDRPKSSQQQHSVFALKQLMHVLCKFWNAVASVHPVVLFLDDLQFADASAKELLTALVTDNSSTNLLVVGAFREGEFEWDYYFDDEKEDSSPSSSSSQKIKKGSSPRWRTSKIRLGQLSQTNVNEIIARVTQRHVDETTSLSQAVYTKTGGNAFFLLQFLDMLQSSGLIYFSFQTNQWEWKQDVAAQTDVCDNIAQLLTRKLGRLSSPTQMVLMLAACLGHSFDQTVLETILLSSEDLRPHLLATTTASSADMDYEGCAPDVEKIQTALLDAVKMGLIERVTERKLKFSHDAIQQASLTMCPEGMDQQRLHARLGERILQLSRGTTTEDGPRAGGEDWMFHSAIDLLTRRASTIEASRFSLVELAQLCLEAGRKALAKSAFVTAASYADRGYSLLSEISDQWRSQYTLSLNLRTLSAEMRHSYGDHEGAMQAASDVVTHAETIADKRAAQNVIIAIRMTQRDHVGAVRECISMLGELGVHIPERASRFHIMFELFRVRRLLKGRRAVDLQQLPPVKDARIVEASRVLHLMVVPAWLSNNEDLCLRTCTKSMCLTLTHGVSAYSAGAFAHYGGALSHLGKLGEGYEYGRLALELQDKFGTRQTLTQILTSVHSIVIHLRDPMVGSLEAFEQAYENGMHVGDVTTAGRALYWRVVYCLHSSMRLDHLETQTRGYCDLLRSYQLDSTLNATLPAFQLVLNLLGKSKNVLVLEGEGIENEAAFVEEKRKQDDVFSLVQLQNCRMVLLVVLDALDLADAERQQSPSEIPGTYYTKCCHWFYSALACLGLARRYKRQRRRRQMRFYRKLAKNYRKRLGKYIEHGSVNCIPFGRLVDAELSSLRRPFGEKTVAAYQAAIRASARCGFRLCRGLACERAGQYLLEQGREVLASDYLQQAWDEFEDHGAVAKLKQMASKYGHSCSFSGESSRASFGRPSSLTKPHIVKEILASCK